MSNASEIYSSIASYVAIQALVGTQESIFIDFKASATTDGIPTNDDKHNFKEALSGFSHQEGGVIVWGIDCRINTTTGVDEALAENPIVNPATFMQRLNDLYPHAIEPTIDGFQQKVIYSNDDNSTNTGFVVTLIPKSYKVHRILNPRRHSFYKRQSTSFWPIETTEDIRSLFFRQISPALEVIFLPANSTLNHLVQVQFNVVIKNNGFALAKHVSLYIKLHPIGVSYFVGGGNARWETWTEILTGDGGRIFSINAGFVIHPQQEMNVCVGQGFFREGQPRPTRLQYKLYAEHMEPIEGEIGL